jgi:hypothetical protein
VSSRCVLPTAFLGAKWPGFASDSFVESSRIILQIRYSNGGERWAHVNPSIVNVTASLASLSVFGTAVAAGLWWLWRRAKDAAKIENRIVQLEEAQAAAILQLEKIRAVLKVLEIREARDSARFSGDATDHTEGRYSDTEEKRSAPSMKAGSKAHNYSSSE